MSILEELEIEIENIEKFPSKELLTEEEQELLEDLLGILKRYRALLKKEGK